MRQRLCKALILAAVLTLVFGGLEIAARLDVGRTVCIPAMRNFELALENYYAELGRRVPTRNKTDGTD